MGGRGGGNKGSTSSYHHDMHKNIMIVLYLTNPHGRVNIIQASAAFGHACFAAH